MQVSAQQVSAFQFTLPRGERLRLAGVAPIGEGVSIHAPAGGATGLFVAVD